MSKTAWTGQCISGAEDNIVVLENRVEDLEVENKDLENKHSALEEERESMLGRKWVAMCERPDPGVSPPQN